MITIIQTIPSRDKHIVIYRFLPAQYEWLWIINQRCEQEPVVTYFNTPLKTFVQKNTQTKYWYRQKESYVFICFTTATDFVCCATRLYHWTLRYTWYCTCVGMVDIGVPRDGWTQQFFCISSIFTPWHCLPFSCSLSPVTHPRSTTHVSFLLQPFK